MESRVFAVFTRVVKVSILALAIAMPLVALSADWADMSSGKHSFQDLGEKFHVKVPVAKVEGARLVLFNRRAAEQLGLKVPNDPKALEKLILQNFAYTISPDGKGDKAWMATYYQDSNSKREGEARGDGRALWSGEIASADGKAIDVVLKGVGQTPLAWLNHSDPGHKDGLQSLREAVHSFVMSEVNFRNELNTTVDLAVIELPIDKVDKHSGKSERAAVTVRIGEQTRVAHLRYWADRPQDVAKVLRYVMSRTLAKKADVRDTQAYLDKFATALADEAARYFDLHAVHSSPTPGNRTTSGATIDLGTFRYLDAHHTEYTYLFDQLQLGGKDGQHAQMRGYLDQVASYLPGEVDVRPSHETFDREFESRLTDLWLKRLGLDRESAASLKPETRAAIYKHFFALHEAKNKAKTYKLGDREFHPAAFEPRRIFPRALSLLNLNEEKRKAELEKLFESDRKWAAPSDKAEAMQERLMKILLRIQKEIPEFEKKVPGFIAQSQLIHSQKRQDLGPGFVKKHEGPIIDAIQSGKESHDAVTLRALKAAQYLVDPAMKINADPNTGRKERIGLYTGTFDPPHRGHREVITRVMKIYELDRMYVMVNPESDHKKTVSDFSLRKKMAKAAFAGIEGVIVADTKLESAFRETDVEGVLRVLESKHRQAGIFQVMGDDSFERFLKVEPEFRSHVTVILNPRSDKKIQMRVRRA